MSGTSESPNELRCDGCNKCLARDGVIACPRCKSHKVLKPEYMEVVAYGLAAHAVTRYVLTGVLPEKVSVNPVDGFVGFLKYAHLPFYTRHELVSQLTAVMAGWLVESSAGAGGSPSSYISATMLARQIIETVEVRPASDEEIRKVMEQCRGDADKLVTAHRALIAAAATELMTSREMDGDQIADVLRKAC